MAVLSAVSLSAADWLPRISGPAGLPSPPGPAPGVDEGVLEPEPGGVVLEPVLPEGAELVVVGPLGVVPAALTSTLALG